MTDETPRNPSLQRALDRTRTPAQRQAAFAAYAAEMQRHGHGDRRQHSHPGGDRAYHTHDPEPRR